MTPRLTPQQEVAAGEEQQRDTLGQGAEEASHPAAHNEHEAQRQDQHNGSAHSCRERGLRVQVGTRTCPSGRARRAFHSLSAWTSTFTEHTGPP